MSFYKKILNHPFFTSLLVVLVVVVTRVPRLLSPNLFLNGDEAVLGVMAQQLLNNGTFPLFFLGQNYGLSTLEVLVISPFVALWGNTDLAVKIPMLMLFATGCCFMFHFVRRVFTVNIAWITCIGLALLPAWHLWSMQARGGYLTAFLLYNVGLWLWTKKLPNLIFVFANFLLFVLVYFSQPLWLLAFLPFVPILSSAYKKLLSISFLVFLAVSFLVPLMLPEAFWSGPGIKLLQVFNNLPKLVDYLPGAFHGQYLLGGVAPVNTLVVGVSVVSFVLLIFLAFFGGFRQSQIPKGHWWLISFIVLYLGQVLALGAGGPRYFLPLFQVLIIFSFAALAGKNKKWLRYAYGFFGLTLVYLTIQVIGYRVFSYNKQYADYEKSTQHLKSQLMEKNIKAVYSLDPLLQWQLMYYSNQQLYARWVNPTDRIEKMPFLVDSIHHYHNDQAALIGHLPFALYDAYKQEVGDGMFQVDSLYFVRTKPSTKLLQRWQMELNNPGNKP